MAADYRHANALFYFISHWIIESLFEANIEIVWNEYIYSNMLSREKAER